jgi:putative transposase
MRKNRVLKDGAKYHVTARANRKEMILETDEIKEMFLDVLARAKKKYECRIENFCIMGNHFHLIIQPMNGSSLSRIMQWILSMFARIWNKFHSLTGHVWGERFFSKIIEELNELRATSIYIDENPLAAGLCETKSEWKFGGYWHRLKGIRKIITDF